MPGSIPPLVRPALLGLLAVTAAACAGSPSMVPETTKTVTVPAPVAADIDARLAKYTTVRLTTDMSALTANERAMIPLLIEAAQAMDAIYWM
ncbi:MAG TPA: hypothetical protein VFV33_08625, partial [Gemmatimonadaceae bacterium]|nr:hypothetical protein [Gemmatimonadaceae bacterium]